MSRGGAALLATVSLGAAPAPQTTPPASLGAAQSATDEPMRRPADARLVWHDEFTRTGAPDPAHWR